MDEMNDKWGLSTVSGNSQNFKLKPMNGNDLTDIYCAVSGYYNALCLWLNLKCMSFDVAHNLQSTSTSYFLQCINQIDIHTLYFCSCEISNLSSRDMCLETKYGWQGQIRSWVAEHKQWTVFFLLNTEVTLFQMSFNSENSVGQYTLFEKYPDTLSYFTVNADSWI